MISDESTLEDQILQRAGEALGDVAYHYLGQSNERTFAEVPKWLAEKTNLLDRISTRLGEYKNTSKIRSCGVALALLKSRYPSPKSTQYVKTVLDDKLVSTIADYLQLRLGSEGPLNINNFSIYFMVAWVRPHVFKELTRRGVLYNSEDGTLFDVNYSELKKRQEELKQKYTEVVEFRTGSELAKENALTELLDRAKSMKDSRGLALINSGICKRFCLNEGDKKANYEEALKLFQKGDKHEKQTKGISS